jgi:ankyrin repeat protein
VRFHSETDAGFPVKPRPPCRDDVLRATADLEPDVIARVDLQAGTFTCGSSFEPSPLDTAVLNDAPAAVRAMLDAGADPNARWSRYGDRFPLQGAIEGPDYARPTAHRIEAIALLLQGGADPGMRWCPFEARATWAGNPAPPCTSDGGVTPLIMATLLDDPGVISLLVDAKADPGLDDWHGANALDYVRSEEALALLRPVLFPGKPSDSDVLTYLNHRHATSTFRGPSPGPWGETPPVKAICCAMTIARPPSPGTTRTSRRVRLLLRLGADPNHRLSWGGVDWTPLALAVFYGSPENVDALLVSGADPNGRWCVPVRSKRDAKPAVPQPGCDSSTGRTPLMLAASLGNPGVVNLLLTHGADRRLTDWRGRTALEYVADDASGIARLLER